MIDINAIDFRERFDVKNGTVGFVGNGYVGKAVETFFSKSCKTLVYDKYKIGDGFVSLSDVVLKSEVIFVAVPTPMKKDGSCHTGIVEEVLRNICDVAVDVNRSLDSFIVVMKSTVVPGFTDRMKKAHPGMRLLFSPEFLTEANSIADFEKQNRIILGGDEDDAFIVFKYFEGVIPERVKNDKILLLSCNSVVAETVKLYANGILATKVMFSNEMNQLCQKLNIQFEEVRLLACLDSRIGSSHTLVPGPDGKLGFGGHCFPKDLNSLKALCKTLGVKEKIISAVLDRNEEIREDKDWEKMKGRAVIDE